MTEAGLTFERFQTATAGLVAEARPELFDALSEERQDECWRNLGRAYDALREHQRALDPLDTSMAVFVSSPERELDLQPTPEKRPPARGSSLLVRAGAESGDNDVLRELPAPLFVEVLTGEEVGRSGKIRCPLPDHDERTPSFHVYTDSWYCFGCGRGGSIYDLGAALFGIEPRGSGFRELRKRLAEAVLGAAA